MLLNTLAKPYQKLNEAIVSSGMNFKTLNTIITTYMDGSIENRARSSAM